MDAKSWIERVAKEAPATVAKRLEVTPSTLDSQMKSASGLKPEMVVKIAREYDPDNVVAALVELGLLTAKEAGAEVDVSEAEHYAWLHKQDDDVLLREIGRRLDERKGATVTPIKPRQPQRPTPNVPVKRSARKKDDK